MLPNLTRVIERALPCGIFLAKFEPFQKICHCFYSLTLNSYISGGIYHL